MSRAQRGTVQRRRRFGKGFRGNPFPNRPWHTSNAEFARSPPPRPVRRNRNVLSLPIWCSPHVRSSRCWKEEEDRLSELGSEEDRLRRDSAFMILKDRMSIPRRWQLRSCYNRRRDNDRRAGGWDINARSMDNVVAPPKARSRNGKQSRLRQQSAQ